MDKQDSSHNGQEMTLILAGHMKDEYGAYGPGDLVIRQDDEMHSPQIGDKEDCICLALTYRPVKMRCYIRRTINLFFRF